MAANSRLAVAVHVLALLAEGTDGRRNSREIASSIATNPVVIRRLLAELARAGIVSSTHGAKGGFRLTRAAKNITLDDVYRAVEDGGIFAVRTEVNEKCPIACRMKDILEAVFSRVESKVAPELRRTTLADVVGQISSPATAPATPKRTRRNS